LQSFLTEEGDDATGNVEPVAEKQPPAKTVNFEVSSIMEPINKPMDLQSIGESVGMKSMKSVGFGAQRDEEFMTASWEGYSGDFDSTPFAEVIMFAQSSFVSGMTATTTTKTPALYKAWASGLDDLIEREDDAEDNQSTTSPTSRARAVTAPAHLVELAAEGRSRGGTDEMSLVSSNSDDDSKESHTPRRRAMTTSKECDLCGQPYKGFGTTCGSCRSYGRKGSMLACPICNTFTIGFEKESCENCGAAQRASPMARRQTFAIVDTSMKGLPSFDVAVKPRPSFLKPSLRRNTSAQSDSGVTSFKHRRRTVGNVLD